MRRGEVEEGKARGSRGDGMERLMNKVAEKWMRSVSVEEEN